MARETSKSVREQMIGSPGDWVKRFDMEDYRDNPPMIEKLYEEKQVALLEARDSQIKVEAAMKELTSLKSANQSLRHQLSSLRQNSWITFSLALLAIILIGVGTGLVVNNPGGCAGWLLGGAGCILEIFSFILTNRGSNDKER